MESQAAPALILTVLLLGLVHGVDWDHIAAISDITGAVPERARGFWLATLYVLGHAFMVILLGILAIIIGLALPDWVDSVMEPVVGITLIVLGIWIVYSLFQNGGEFQFRSRWMLFFDGIRAIVKWLGGQLRGSPQPLQITSTSTYGVRSALAIGMIHGIGAETATQAALFLAAAGAGGKVLGSILLITFVTGLVISNSIITIATLFGFQTVRRNNVALRIAGGAVALFSFVLGVLFVLGQGTLLPSIIGWEPPL